METYIGTRLQEALENLESGVQFSQPVYIRKALLELDALKKVVAKNSETALLVTQSIIRGCTAMCLLDPMNAISHLRVALKCDPNHPAVLNNLGYMYHTQYSDWDKSVQYYTACLTADPTYVTGYRGLIEVYRVLRHTTLELEYCRRGVGYCPESPELWNALGLALVNTDRSEAQNAFDMCLSLKTGTVTRCKALANLGHMAGIAGDIETALSRYMDAIETDANQPTAYQNILLNLHFFATPDLRTSKALRRVLRYFQVEFSTRGTPSNVTQIDEVIRDVHNRVATKLYPCQKDSVPDDPPPDVGGTHRDLTRKLTIGPPSILMCIQTVFMTLIPSQPFVVPDIDILIDLSGHAAGNRLDVFALHPVPVMLSYCGYPNVTGINGLRRISVSYTEKFNPKVQDEAVLLPEFQSRITLLRHTTTPVNHLESFKLIDIYLDTFPYSGTTITCESLYMNVPVVTFAPVSIRSVGHVARVSGSILAEMGNMIDAPTEFRRIFGSNTTRANIHVETSVIDSVGMARLYARTAVMLCTSEMEGYGHYINQARAAGVLVVTTDHAPMNELVNNRNGILVSYESVSPNEFQILGPFYKGPYGLKNSVGIKVDVSGESICNGMDWIVKLTESERQALAEAGRVAYVADALYFKGKMMELHSLYDDKSNNKT
ncbi:hypothetical protein HDU81_009381 [Chytriomyces hyalinus]|nr:hypothetical protein HDU81_009381 [Chytriomyces hyalinus]